MTTSTPRKPSPKTGVDDIRLVSANKLAVYLGVTSQTVFGWIDQGCPRVEEATTKGRAHILDIAQVVDWLRRCDREKAAAKALDTLRRVEKRAQGVNGSPKGKDRDAWDALKAQAQAEIAVIEAAERRRAVAPVDLMDEMMSKRDELVANALREVENKVEGDLPPGVVRGVLGPIVRKHINSALRTMSSETIRDVVGELIPYDEIPDTSGPRAEEAIDIDQEEAVDA